MLKIKKNLVVFLGLIIIFIAIIAVVVNIFSRSMINGDYPYYSDVKSITDAADAVIIGEVVEAKDVQHLIVGNTSNISDKERTTYTLSKVKVTEVLKGNINVGDIITIKQIGDYKLNQDETLHKTSGYLSKNTINLMFLCEYDTSPYSPVNPAQGIIEIKNGQVLYSANKYSLFGYDDGLSEKADMLNTAIELIKIYVNDL